MIDRFPIKTLHAHRERSILWTTFAPLRHVSMVRPQLIPDKWKVVEILI